MRRVSGIIDLEYAHKNGIYGQGINVAIVDSGIAPHDDIIRCGEYMGRNRLIAAYDAVSGKNGFYDDNGHGTHVAGIIGAAGRQFTGVAPACGFVSVKVLDGYGSGRIENVLRGIDWILENRQKYNIRIVNLSVGQVTEKGNDEESVLVKKVEELWDEEIVVLAAAGNDGPGSNSIGAPGLSKKIITVGASDDNIIIFDRKKGYIKNYSGRGPTRGCVMKPDIVAPGSHVMSCSNRNNRYCAKSGTSMSTPVVSGAIALLLSKYADLNNRDIKIRLKNTAVDMGLSHERQGWGRLNVRTLLEGKKSYEKYN